MGAVVIPTLALGVFSSGSRVFEVVYLIWWYIGRLQKTQGMDFMTGEPPFSSARIMPVTLSINHGHISPRSSG